MSRGEEVESRIVARDAAAQRRGVGRALLTAAEKWARRRGASAVLVQNELETSPNTSIDKAVRRTREAERRITMRCSGRSKVRVELRR